MLVLEQLNSSSVFWVRDTQFVGEDPKILEVMRILGRRIENFSPDAWQIQWLGV